MCTYYILIEESNDNLYVDRNYLKIENDLSILKLFREQKIFPLQYSAISIICGSSAIKADLFSSLFLLQIL